MLIVMSPYTAPADQYPESRDLPADAALIQSALAAPETDQVTTDAADANRQQLLEQAEAIHGDLGSPRDWVLFTPTVALAAVTKANEVNRQLAADWRHRAQHDTLTGLVNQGAWHELLHERLELGRPTGVFVLDLSGFKGVNDALGHETGNTLLAALGELLDHNFTRIGDVITESTENDDLHDGVPGRTGGDEFQIMVDLSENNRRGDDPESRLARAYEYLEEKLAAYVAAQPEAVRVLNFGVAVGAAMSIPNSEASIEDQMRDLLQRADQQMYEHKLARKLEALSDEQKAAWREIGRLAAQHGLDLRAAATLVDALGQGA